MNPGPRSRPIGIYRYRRLCSLHSHLRCRRSGGSCRLLSRLGRLKSLETIPIGVLIQRSARRTRCDRRRIPPVLGVVNLGQIGDLELADAHHDTARPFAICLCQLIALLDASQAGGQAVLRKRIAMRTRFSQNGQSEGAAPPFLTDQPMTLSKSRSRHCPRT